MKKIIISLIFFALILSCAACQDNVNTSSSENESSNASSQIETEEASSKEESSIQAESSEEESKEASSSEAPQEESSVEENSIEESSKEESSVEESSEEPSEGSGAVAELSQDELNEIQELLNKIENNGFISSNYYNSPEEIDITLVFYDGAGIKIPLNQWAEGESDAVLSAMNLDEFYTSPFKINYSDADEHLKKNTGLSLESFGSKIDRFTFVEAYNAFYTMRSDTNFMTVSVSDGSMDENGILKINYTSSFIKDSTFTVTLRKTENGFQFISNIKNVTN